MRTEQADGVTGGSRMWLCRAADRASSVLHTDCGDAPPEVLITATLLGALGAVSLWLISLSTSGSGFLPSSALVMGVFAVVLAEGYVMIKALYVVNFARRSRAHETGE